MLKIYDSLSQKKRIFIPIQTGKVSLYVCGMTVYDHCHIGHARGFIVFDVIKSYFEYQGISVTLVRNITDIDDKIIDRAQKQGVSPEELAKQFIQSMQEDVHALGLKPPEHEPRATDYIAPMITLIQKLITQGSAYVADNGDVCFDVRQFEAYGKLSKRDIAQLRSGGRVGVEESKHDPLDFVLWKQAKPYEPFWPSPWGDGRPGWHIECSAMASALLGQPFDIHGGGMDLKFPHHENEIAQSEASSKKGFAKTWMHVGLVQIDGMKMSKSRNNFLTIKAVLDQYHPEVVRYFMIASHYRSPVNFSLDNLTKAQRGLMRLYKALEGFELSGYAHRDARHYHPRFQKAMDDDFNTPKALAVLFDIAHAIQRKKAQGEPAKALAYELKTLGGILGILQTEGQALTQEESKCDVAEIDDLIEKRQIARAEKNWQKADQIREQLSQLGVVLEDHSDGSRWKKI